MQFVLFLIFRRTVSFQSCPAFVPAVAHLPKDFSSLCFFVPIPRCTWLFYMFFAFYPRLRLAVNSANAPICRPHAASAAPCFRKGVSHRKGPHVEASRRLPRLDLKRKSAGHTRTKGLLALPCYLNQQ